jgi:hypothetical protein
MVEMIIKFTDDGQVLLTGPLHDKIFCYGLLVAAHDIIKDIKPKSSIVPIKDFKPVTQ